MPWQVETARATVFAANVDVIGLADFQTAIGQAPTQTLSQAGVTTNVGTDGAHQFILSRQSIRADLAILPVPQVAVSAAPPSLGNLTAVIQSFLPVVLRWLTPNTDVQRIALYSLLWEGAPNQDAALASIAHNVRSFRFQAGERIEDFLIRINRPRDSRSAAGLEINRLTQWSVVSLQQITLTPWMGINQSPALFTRSQVEIDINTPPTSPVRMAYVPGLIGEFSDLMQEISTQGDVP